jgi:hypothetical protein
MIKIHVHKPIEVHSLSVVLTIKVPFGRTQIFEEIHCGCDRGNSMQSCPFSHHPQKKGSVTFVHAISQLGESKFQHKLSFQLHPIACRQVD